MMKKLLALLFVSLIFAGCAAKNLGTSNFERVYPLKGETLVIVVKGHDAMNGFLAKTAQIMGQSFSGGYGINALVYTEPTELTLSESSLADFARNNRARFILVKTFKSISLYNSAVSSFDEELALFSIMDGKIIWKATIKYDAPMAMGRGHAAKASRDKTIEMLKKDGFINNGF